MEKRATQMEKQSIKDLDERYSGIKGGSLFVLGGKTGCGRSAMPGIKPDNNRGAWIQDLDFYWNSPRNNIPANPDCLHTQCSDCHGTGQKENGDQCIHSLSCPCPRCTPRY